MKPATRNLIIVFLLLCAVGYALNYIPVEHSSTPASSTETVEVGSH